MLNASVVLLEVQQCCKTHYQHHTWLSVEEMQLAPHEVISFGPWKVPIRYRASWHLEGCWTWSVCQFRKSIAQPTHAKWGSKLKISPAWKRCEQPFFFSTQPRELNWFLSEIVTPAMSAEHGSTELSSTPCTRIKILDIPWSSVLCLRVSLRDCV